MSEVAVVEKLLSSVENTDRLSVKRHFWSSCVRSSYRVTCIALVYTGTRIYVYALVGAYTCLGICMYVFTQV